MRQCISRHPSAQLTLIGTRIGAKVAKAIFMSAAAGRLTPEILSEALQSSSTVRSHVQREAVKLLMVRVSMRAPQQLQWLLRLVGDFFGGLSLTDAISSLAQRSLLYQVTTFGLRGSAASAITTAAVQIGLTTCTLITTNAAFWRKGTHKMSIRQYRYELLTSVYTGVGAIAGGAAGAAVGSMVMPGVGTAFGSVLCSVGGSYVPGYMRDKKGPDDRQQRQVKELERYTPLRMQDTREGAVLMYKEELTESTAAAATAITVASTTSAAATAPSSLTTARLSQDTFGADVESASSCDEVLPEEEATVWLDFVRATTLPMSITTTMTTTAATAAQNEEKKEGTLSSSHTTRSASTSASSWGSLNNEEHRPRDGSAGVRSFLRFSPPSDLTTSAKEEADQHGASAVNVDDVEGGAVHGSATEKIGGGSAERFRGHAKYITVSTEEEFEDEVAKFCGEEDLMLVFTEV